MATGHSSLELATAQRLQSFIEKVDALSAYTIIGVNVETRLLNVPGNKVSLFIPSDDTDWEALWSIVLDKLNNAKADYQAQLLGMDLADAHTNPGRVASVNVFWRPTIVSTIGSDATLYEDADVFYAPLTAAANPTEPGLHAETNTFFVPTVAQE